MKNNLEQAWKEEARKAYQDQQSQDNEGGCREPIGFVQGYFAAKKSDFEEIKTLKEQLAEAVALMKTQKDCIDHLLGKRESFGDSSTVGFGTRVDAFLEKQDKENKE